MVDSRWSRSMQLPGRLSATTLGDLLGGLHRARVTGVLELLSTTLSNSHRIHFFCGLVERIDSPLGAPPIGELLRRRGAVDARAIGHVIGSSNDERPIGELLVDIQAVKANLVAAVLREQLRERLEALFSLSDAAIRFHPARRSGRPFLKPLPLLAPDFLHGRPRKHLRISNAERISAAKRLTALRVLGLETGADTKTIRGAFRQRAMLTHPDRHPGATVEQRASLAQSFAALSAAYHALLD